VVPDDSFRHFRRVEESRIEVSEKEITGLSAGGAKAPAAPEKQGRLVPRADQGAVSKPPAREKKQSVVVKKAPQGGRKDQSPSAAGWEQQPQKQPQLKPAPQQPRTEPQPRAEPQLKPAPQQPQKQPQLKPAPQQPQKQPQLEPAPQKPQRQPQVQQGSKKENTPQPTQKRRKVMKKKLVNGKWVWVEEWETVEE